MGRLQQNSRIISRQAGQTNSLLKEDWKGRGSLAFIISRSVFLPRGSWDRAASTSSAAVRFRRRLGEKFCRRRKERRLWETVKDGRERERATIERERERERWNEDGEGKRIGFQFPARIWRFHRCSAHKRLSRSSVNGLAKVRRLRQKWSPIIAGSYSSTLPARKTNI